MGFKRGTRGRDALCGGAKGHLKNNILLVVSAGTAVAWSVRLVGSCCGLCCFVIVSTPVYVHMCCPLQPATSQGCCGLAMEAESLIDRWKEAASEELS